MFRSPTTPSNFPSTDRCHHSSLLRPYLDKSAISTCTDRAGAANSRSLLLTTNHSPLATSPITPFPATLRGKSQLIENPAALSPALATLTRHLHLNPFVCHSYKKHRGSHLSNQKSLRSGFSRP